MTKLKAKTKKPRLLKGFQDFFVEDMLIREYVINTFKKIFEKYGYEPLETPALEYSELMLDQSGEEAEKQYYRFKDPGGRDVMLKFEVMISMCRAVAQNLNKIQFPYKRYQIQRTWRAENTQRGRYREFTQCDADTVGSSSMLCDAEFIQMGLEVVNELGFKKYVARISNRKFIQGLAEYVGIAEDRFYGFCMSIDKLSKIGSEKVIDEMVKRRGIEKQNAEKALKLIGLEQYKNLSFRQTVEQMMKTVGSTKIGKEGLDELLEILEYFEVADIEPKLYKFDPSIARGLASYTGPVWEYEVLDGGVGSIGGCGRYDKAIGKYIGKEIPATGGSFGIERICDIIKDRKMLDLGKTCIDALVTVFSEDLWRESLKVADKMRSAGVSAMLYPDTVQLKKQFKYADKKDIKWVVVIGEDEVKQNKVTLKDMESGEQVSMSIDAAINKILK
ncbi:MAG: histidine--tRNA ligase [Patescibacteria group bacterium]|nr:histidine--tRNA ligase [Patescibacteria group bacterium]